MSAEEQSITITVELGELLNRYGADDEPLTIADSLLKVASWQLLEQLPRDLVHEMTNRARDITDAQIEKAIAPLIADAVSRAIQPTDRYGNAKGEPTTLAEAITKAATDALTKPTGNNGYGPRETILGKLIREEVERTINRELKGAMDEARDQVKSAVQQEGAKIIAETIARTAGVR